MFFDARGVKRSRSGVTIIDVLRKSIVLLDALSGGADVAPPTEFRLFKAGVNKTLKGDVVLDAAALSSVLTAYAAYGNDLVMDLEHRSLGAKSADDTNAMAWFKLAGRDGELWAVDVKWTPAGAKRLSDKSQRYISPAVLTDENNKAVEIINCALVAMPATLHTPALIAAHRKVTLSNMTPEQVQKAVEAMTNDDLDALKTIVTELMAGASTEEKPPEEDPALAEMTAAAPELMSATGATTIKDAVTTVLSWAKTAKETADKAAVLELSSRMTLVGDLVKLGAETPATAYADKDGKKVLVPRLLSEDFASLRERVVALKASKGERPVNLKPPTSAVKTFSASEVAGAKKLGITPEEFVVRKNAQVRTAQ